MNISPQICSNHDSVNEPFEEPYLSLEEVGVALEHLRSFAGKVSV